MCNQTLNQFLINKCSKTPPGVNRVLLTRKQWIDTIPAIDTTDTDSDGVPDAPNTITSDITLDTATFTDAKWVEWQSTLEKAGFVSTLTGDFGASYHESELELYMPGHSALLSFVLNESVDDELVVLFQDKSLSWRLFGDSNTPAFVSYAFDLGKARGDSVGYTVKLVVPIHDKAFPFYTGVVPTI